MHLVFVYGTLKKGYRNYKYFLDQLEPIKAELEGFTLHAGPYFPFAKRSKGKEIIKGEIYQINDEKLKQLDMLEGVPHHYQRVICYPQVKGKAKGDEPECWIYISDIAAKYPIIKNGEWK